MNDLVLKVSIFVINLVLGSTVAACWVFSYFIWNTLKHDDPFGILLYGFSLVVTAAFFRRVSTQ